MLLPSFCIFILFLSDKLVLELVVLTANLLTDGEGGRHIAVLIYSTRESYAQFIGIAGSLVEELIAIVGVPYVCDRGGIERCLWAGEGDIGHIGFTASGKCYRAAVCLRAVITSTGPCAAVRACRTLGSRRVVVDDGIVIVVATCYEGAAECESGYC